jgi:hypothetical protein
MTRENLQSIVLATACRIDGGIHRVLFEDGTIAEWYMGAWAVVYNNATESHQEFGEIGVLSDGDYVSAFEQMIDFLFDVTDVMRKAV